MYQHAYSAEETFLEHLRKSMKILNPFCSIDAKHQLPIFAIYAFNPHPKFVTHGITSILIAFMNEAHL